MHFSMRCFHCSMHVNSSSSMPLSATVKFFWMSSTLWKRWPLRVFLILRNKKKSHEARSGEYGGWSNTFTWFFAKVANFKGRVHGCAVLVEQPEVVYPQLRRNTTNLFAETSEDVQIQVRIHCGLLGQKFFMDHTFLIKKCKKHCFHLWLQHPVFLQPCFALTLRASTLSHFISFLEEGVAYLTVRLLTYSVLASVLENFMRFCEKFCWEKIET